MINAAHPSPCSLRLFADDQPLAFAALPKALPLWACLLLRRDEVVSRGALAFTLWPDVSEEQAKANLRRHLYELRRVLPEPPADTPWLLITPQTAQSDPRAPYWLDVAAFQQMAQQPGRVDEAVRLVRRRAAAHAGRGVAVVRAGADAHPRSRRARSA